MQEDNYIISLAITREFKEQFSYKFLSSVNQNMSQNRLGNCKQIGLVKCQHTFCGRKEH